MTFGQITTLPLFDPFAPPRTTCPRCRCAGPPDWIAGPHGCTALLTARRTKEAHHSHCGTCGHMEREHYQNSGDRLALQFRGIDPDEAPVRCAATSGPGRSRLPHGRTGRHTRPAAGPYWQGGKASTASRAHQPGALCARP